MSTSQENKKKEKLLRCIVISSKMQKSRVGRIERLVKHPVVGKYIRQSTKIMFHDETNMSNEGDEVLVRSCRPRSGRKAFELDSVVVTGSN